MLTGLRFLLTPNGDSSSDALQARFEQARGIVDELLERVRGLSFDLRPAALVLALAVPLAFALEALGARWLVFSLTALASAAFLYLALFSARTWLHALLTARVVVYTGIISYGLYLLHKMPLDVAQALHLDRHPALALTLALGTAYALAVVSRRWLEQPFLRLKRLFEPKAHRAELAPAQLVAVPK